MSEFIPVSEPWLDGSEERYVLEALRSGWISGGGPFLKRFEKEWAAVCGRRHGIAVSNGTAALETAVHALELPAGSEVVMPDFTMIACLNAVVRNRLAPVFVDADPATWCMDEGKIEERITPRTRAIMAVHIYGHPMDMDRVRELAARHGLKVIEDAAEAHGARCRAGVCGGFGDVATFSFYGNKIVTCGEGGMVVCDDDAVADRCRRYRDMGFGEKRFVHSIVGQNFRMTNLQAAIGCAQVERLAETLRRKKHMAGRYAERLGGLRDVQLPAAPAWGTNVYWVYGVVLGESYPWDAEELGRRLKVRGVDSRPFFVGMHEQPVTTNLGIPVSGAYPVSERLARRGLYLPSSSAISDAQIDTVAEALRESLED